VGEGSGVWRGRGGAVHLRSQALGEAVLVELLAVDWLNLRDLGAAGGAVGGGGRRHLGARSLEVQELSEEVSRCLRKRVVGHMSRKACGRQLRDTATDADAKTGRRVWLCKVSNFSETRGQS
jgi:hypothetical protein